jgi:hypothetical protein
MDMTNKVIWVAEDHHINRVLVAANHFDDILDWLAENGHLQPKCINTYFTDKRPTIYDHFCEKWLESLKKLSAVCLNEMLEWEIVLRQVEIIE